MEVGGQSLLWFEKVRMNLGFKEAREVAAPWFFLGGQ